MKTETVRLTIIPAYFVRYAPERDQVILDCLIENRPDPIVQRRPFSRSLVRDIKDPTKLFIGILNKSGELTHTCICGKRYHKPFFWLEDHLKRLHM